MRELTRMCKVRLGVGLGLLLMVPSACGGDAEPTIRIGTVLTTSGDLAEVGNDELEAASLAVDEINAQGGVLDQQLELIHRDDGLDVARGQAAAQALIDLKATVILGSVASSITLAVSEVTTASRVVQISAGSTSALISKAKDDGFLFRTCPSDALQAKVIAKRARAKGVSKIAVIYVPNTYGESLKDVFEQEFQAGGGTITYKRSYAEGQISYAGQLTELFATGPEAVLLIGYPVDGAQVINDYVASFASEGTFWYFSDGLFNNTFVTAVGASNFTFPHEGTHGSLANGPRIDAFVQAYEQRYNRRPSINNNASNAYDAIYLAALAIQAGGSAEGSSIRDSLQAVSRGGTGYGALEFKEAMAAIRANQDIDFEGTAGDLDFDDDGDVTAPFSIWKVVNGVLTDMEQNILP